MEATINFFIVLLVFFGASGALSILIDRKMRARKIYMQDATFAIVIPLVAALLVDGYSIATHDPAAGYYFMLFFVCFAYFNLPAIPLRRIERFERKLHFEGVKTLNGKQARKRFLMVLPFFVHPTSAYLMLRVGAARGKMLYGHKPLATGLGMTLGFTVGPMPSPGFLEPRIDHDGKVSPNTDGMGIPL